MNTILTDDERMAIWAAAKEPRLSELKLIGATEAAVLAKLARQEPALLVRCELPQHKGQWMAEDGRRFLLSDPAPQQADRQRVPEGWIGVVQAARDVLSDAEDHLAKPHSTAVRVALMQLDAMLAAAPEAPAQASAVDERAAFEAWYETAACIGIEPSWAAWQARATLAQKGGDA